MKFKALIGTSILAMTVATPAFAQDAADEAERDAFGGEIVVTAQRQSERLQDVPIAVSAFSTEALEAQQIKTPSDLQLTLPNVTFTKTNFTGASCHAVAAQGSDAGRGIAGDERECRTAVEQRAAQGGGKVEHAGRPRREHQRGRGAPCGWVRHPV